VLDRTDPAGAPIANSDLGFGGILGTNALTSGYLEHLFTENNGFFERINLDFSEDGEWFMELIENADFERATGGEEELAFAAESEEDALFGEEFESALSMRTALDGSPWVMLATDPVSHLGAVSTSVPAPGAFTVLSLGAASLLAARPRRRRAAPLRRTNGQ